MICKGDCKQPAIHFYLIHIFVCIAIKLRAILDTVGCQLNSHPSKPLPKQVESTSYQKAENTGYFCDIVLANVDKGNFS